MKSWNDVSVRTFEKVLEVSLQREKYSGDTEYGLRVTAALIDIPYAEILKYTEEDFQKLNEELSWSAEPVVHNGKEEYIIEGKKFQAVKNYNKLTFGAIIDIENIIKDAPQHKFISSVLPILVREVQGKKMVDHSAEAYEKYVDVLQDKLSIADVIHLQDFF